MTEPLPPLVISCICNWSDQPEDGHAFEQMLNRFKKRIEPNVLAFQPVGDLKRAYVQFEYGCESLPEARSGVIISPYSKKERHIGAYVAITRAQFAASSSRQRDQLILMSTVDVLRQMSGRLDGKVANNLPVLIKELQQLGTTSDPA